MKLYLIALLSLNLLVFAMQWVVQRSKVMPEQYIERPGVNRLEFLKEYVARHAVEQSGAPAQCLLLGPLPKKELATYWHRQFNWAGIASEEVVQQLALSPAYMVYFGPLKSQQQAMHHLREFHALNIVDSYLISSGKLENAISLGLYETIELAKARQEELQRQGFAVQMDAMPRQKDEYWVYVSSPYHAENKEKIERVMAANPKRPETRQIFCKSVASEKTLP